MIDEKGIRGIYEGIYGLAELIGDGEYTHDLAWRVHILMGNNVQQTLVNTAQTQSDHSREASRLALIVTAIDGEYFAKFDRLEARQKELEARQEEAIK